MSEQGEKPEVLPGDLITRPGLYEARCGRIVPITGWDNGWWTSEWDGTLDWYSSHGRRRFYEAAGADEWQLLHWVGPLPSSEPKPETTTEQLAEIEGQGEQEPQPEPVQVREGRWRTRDGNIRNVTPTPDNGREHSYPWWDAAYGGTWTLGGRYYFSKESPWDLVEYLGPLEQQPQTQSQPPMLQDADERIRLLMKQCNDTQAETIKRLMAEARDLNMEIGGLERQLLQRDARIRDLETMHAAAAQAVVDAGKQNDALRLQVQNQQQECERQKGRIEFLETLNKNFNAAINGYKTQVAELLGSVDTARGQLEAAATERDELRAAIDAADKQLDQKDAQIRDLRIELDAAQQVQQPVGDEERERIWDEATEAAGRQVVRWLRPLTLALNRQPDERFSRFMALTLSVLPDVLPELLGYAVEDESDCEE